jgi:hypothetical protein
MAEYKKHHYVPQFYLKNFSHNRHVVYTYNLNHKKEFRIKTNNICKEDYFYGNNVDFEKSLSKLEDEHAIIIRKLINNPSIYSLELKEQLHLDLFILMLHSRTKLSSKFMDEFINAFYDTSIKPLLKDSLNLKEKGYSSQEIDATSLKMDTSQLFAMETAMKGVDLISDLFPVFLINDTEEVFVTSDNCVCLYNYVKLKGHGTLGFQSPGLQIFCPLNENLVLLLVDQAHYQIDLDNNRNGEGTVYINKSSDIDAINKLQILNCDETIIYSDEHYQNHIMKLHSEVESFLSDNLIDLTTFSEKRKTENKDYNMHVTSRKAINWHMKLSFIRLNHQRNKQLKMMVKKADKAGKFIHLRRDPALCQFVREKYLL